MHIRVMAYLGQRLTKLVLCQRKAEAASAAASEMVYSSGPATQMAGSRWRATIEAGRPRYQ